MRTLLTVILAGTCGYAPPPLSTHVGAPGRIDPEQGDVHLAGGWGGFDLPHGTLGGSIPAGEGVHVELGGDAAGADGSLIGWVNGNVGVRYTTEVDPRVLLDVEGGAAAGVGGNCVNAGPRPCDPDDPFHIFDRPSGGAYLGGGVGLWFEEDHAFYARLRTQLGFAAYAPITFYGSLGAGFDFGLEVLRVNVFAGGYLGATERWSFGYGFVEAGITVPIGEPAPAVPARPSEELGDPF